MRRTLIGLAAAGLLVVTGCSDSDSGGGESASGGGSTDDFCADFQALEDRFADDPEAANDMEQVVGALDDLDPPDEIADDFRDVLDAYGQFVDVNPDDPDAVEQAQAVSEDVAAAEDRVDTFLQDECGIGATPDGGSGGDTSATDDSAPE
ncbi:MAG TPA: hypothetical protein VF015_13600 [Acidimicrobiales bacterium]